MGNTDSSVINQNNRNNCTDSANNVKNKNNSLDNKKLLNNYSYVKRDTSDIQKKI